MALNCIWLIFDTNHKRIDEKHVHNRNDHSKEDNNSFKNKKLIYFKSERFKMPKHNETSCNDWRLYFHIMAP